MGNIERNSRAKATVHLLFLWFLFVIIICWIIKISQLPIWNVFLSLILFGLLQCLFRDVSGGERVWAKATYIPAYLPFQDDGIRIAFSLEG